MPVITNLSIHVIFGRVVLFILGLLIVNDIFNGTIKYYAALSALPLLSNAPLLGAALVVLLYYVFHGAIMRMHKSMFIFLAFFLFSVTGALILGRTISAVGFATYIWVPFFIGLLCVIYEKQYFFQKHALLLWSLATIGVLLNALMAFPWSGASYEVFGQSIVASRDWTTFGIKRYAGFSRASFAAANQIGFFCLIILVTHKSRLTKLIVWVLSIIAIYLTTSKTTLAIVALAPFVIGLLEFLFRAPAAITLKKSLLPIRLAHGLTLFLCGLMVLSPILTLAVDTRNISSDNFFIFTFSSIFDRMARMWPDAWDLLVHTNPLALITGRGLGGIGTPQLFFEPTLYNSADNFFLYLYIVFGVGSFVIIGFLLSGMRKWPQDNSKEFTILFMMTSYIFLVGTTSNIVESPTLLLIVGILVGVATRAKTQLQR